MAQTPVDPAAPPLPDPAIPLPAQKTEPRQGPTGGQLVKLEFPNADVRQVLEFYGQLTGKKVVYDNTISGAVNIVAPNPLAAEEAIKIIEINLLLNGFSMVPADQGIVKVLGLSKNPRTTGVPIIFRESQIPVNDQIITYLFKLQYADPTELQQTLAQYIAPSAYTSVVALPKSQTLLITESSPVIRGLLKIIAEIDVAPAEVVSEFISLERADAKDVLEKLEKIFEITGSAGSTQGSRPGNAPAPPPGAQPGVVLPGRAPTALSEDTIISGKIKLTADIRTNRIHVITRPVNLPFLRKLVKEFDSNIQFGEPATRNLKYVSAGDVLEVVVKAISEPGAKPEDAGAANTAGNNRARPATTNAGIGSRGGYTGGMQDGGTQFSEELATEDKDTTPTAVTVGNTKIIADRRANTIIVLGNEEAKQKIFKVLDEIDVRAPQLMLNTVIGELTLTDDQTFGVDYLLRYTGNNPVDTGSSGLTARAARRTGFAGISRGVSSNPIMDVASLVTAGSFPTATGLTGFIGVTDSLEIIVRALQATGNFRITNRPMVFTSNNKKAIIASGQEIAVPTNTLTSLNASTLNNQNASVSSSVSFKKVALQLEVVPLINSDREVSMEILQKLDSVVPGADRDVGGSSVPTISTRYIKSTVNVANRATVALGGLITRNQSDSLSGIPVLSKIPALGALFRTKSKTRKRDELVILIRPVVTMGPAEDLENSRLERERLIINSDLEQDLIPNVPQKATVPFRYQK